MTDTGFGGDDMPAELTQEGLEHFGCCPSCGETQRKKLYVDLSARIFGCAHGRSSCSDCGFACLDLRPSQESISRCYATYYKYGRKPVARNGLFNRSA